MSKYVLYYQHEQHTVHLIVYHIIWCPKSRRKVLLGDLAHRLELIIQEVAKEHTWEIIRVAVQPDHVHLFIRSNPSIMPTDIAWTIFSCAQGRVSHVAEASIFVDALYFLHYRRECKRRDDTEVY